MASGLLNTLGGFLTGGALKKAPQPVAAPVSYNAQNSSVLTAPSKIGVQAKSPVVSTPSNTLPTNQVKQTTTPQNTGTLAADDPSNKYNTSMGQLNTNYKDPNAPVAQPNYSAPQPVQQSSDTGLYGKLVTDLANRSTQSGEDYKAAQAEANRVAEEQTAQATDYAHKTNNIAGTAGFLTQQSGLQGQLTNQYNTVQGALSSQAASANSRLGAANTQQGLLQQALSSAVGAVSPQMQFGQLTSPLTGNPINGGSYGGNPQLQSAVQQAVQLVQAGTDPNSSQVQGLLSTFGLPGLSAFTQAMQQVNNGTYNPTAQSAISTSNATQGVNYKQSAVDLDTSLKQLDTIKSLASNFLTNNKLLNPSDNPNLNAGINTYIGTFKDPAAKLQYSAILGDIKKFTSSILASNNGTIPTDVTNTLSTFDPSTLSAPQLAPYLDTLKQLGDNQLSILQNQTTNLIPSQTNNYTGTPTKVNTAPVPTPQSTSTNGAHINNPYVQAGVGTVMNFFGGLEHAISGLFSKIF